MNDILYNYLIEPWIPLYERPILQRRHKWLYAYKKIKKDDDYCCLMTDVILHACDPCNTRYCICRYFFREDKVNYYRNILYD